MVNMVLSRKNISRCRTLLFCFVLTVITLIISRTQLNLSDNRYVTDLETTRKKTAVTLEKFNPSTTSRRQTQSSAAIYRSMNRQRSTVKNSGNYTSMSNDKTGEKRTSRMETPNSTLSQKRDIKTVIILAYMHTGSTYTAQMIQNHPGTFYEFEPLRSLQKSSRKKRIVVYLNGASRQLSGEELDTDVGAEAVANMVTCDHEKLDIASLSTYFPGSSDTMNYFDCLFPEDRYRITGQLNSRRLVRQDKYMNHSHRNKANLSLKSFQESPSQFNYHKDVRHGKNIFSTEEEHLSRNMRVGKHSSKRQTLYGLDSRTVTDRRDKFHDLVFSTMKENIEKCLPLLTNKCKEANVRLTKFIRMTMEMAGKLLESNPDIRVIHLLRDPRAMMDSQLRKNDMNVNVFHFFRKRTWYMCSHMRKDLSFSAQLKTRYPDRIFTLRYEDLVDDPLKTGQRIFDFIDIPFTPVDEEFVVSTSIDTQHNATYRANKWRKHISQRHLNVVNTYCKDLYKELGYVNFNSIDSVRNLALQDHL